MPGLDTDIRAILDEVAVSLARIDHADVGALVKRILGCPAVFVAGAGRSGLVMRCFAMRLMQMGLCCHVVGETATPAISGGDLLVAGSGSGETSCLAAICGKAREKGAIVSLVTANPESSCGGLADIVLKVRAPTPKAAVASGTDSVQPLGSLFEQGMFILLEAVAMELMRATGQTAEDMAGRHANLE